MRRVRTFVAMAAAWCSLASLAVAEDERVIKSPVDKKVETKADAQAIAALRADIHRTLAELIEAQSAKQPDQAKIEKLTKNLQQLRGKLRAQAAAPAGNERTGWNCPRGGFGMGFGRGAAWGGRGRGFGGGRGAGFGPGGGLGPSGGVGCGFGPGGGLGLAPGGPAFADKDHDGICDHYELRHGMHD